MEIPREELNVKDWDPWQKGFIEHEGSVTLRAGRQVGKSAACGKRKANHMIKYPGSISLMVAPAQRQSSELFQKTMFWLNMEHQKLLEAAGGFKPNEQASQRRNMELRRLFEKEHGLFAEQPTKTTVMLRNGSICYSLPAGKTGTYLRCYALDFLDIDEAAFVPDQVEAALEPMLWVSKTKRGLGWKTYTSTPFGKGGFFFDSHQSDKFKQFHRSSEDCDRIPREDLLEWKKEKTTMQYAQDVLGEFVDEFQQYFPTILIKDCMKHFIRWNFKEHYKPGLRYYYGHDYAGPGKDDNAGVIAEMDGKKPLRIIEPEEDEEPNTTIVNRKIVTKDEKFKFKKLIVDSGGFGCGPTDELKNLLGRRVLGLDNAKKTLDKDGRTGKIFKEDLYSNAKSMMERGDLHIISNLKLLSSLRSMTFEYTADRNLKIKGKKSHLSEAFVRACWCVKERGRDIWIA